MNNYNGLTIKIFNVVGNFNDVIKKGEDIDLWFRIALAFPEIGYSYEVGAYS